MSGLLQLSIVPQQLFVVKNNIFVLLLTKIVDDKLATGETVLIEKFIKVVNAYSKLGTVAHVLRRLQYFCNEN